MSPTTDLLHLVHLLVENCAEPRLYRNNPFHVLGVDASASTAAIRMKQKSASMKAAAGFATDQRDGAILRFGEVPCADMMARATLALENPVERAIAELFWVWPPSSPSDAGWTALLAGNLDECLAAWRQQTASMAEEGNSDVRHHVAVIDHALALECELCGEAWAGDDREQLWRRALASWTQVLVDDQFWLGFSARCRRLEDPRLTDAVVDRMRAAVVDALRLLSSRLALAAARDGEVDRVRLHRANAAVLSGDPGVTADAAVRAMQPLRDELVTALQAVVQKACTAPAELRNDVIGLVAKARRSLAVVDLMLDPGDLVRVKLHDEVADGLFEATTRYFNATKDAIVARDNYAICAEIAHSPVFMRRLSLSRASIAGWMEDYCHFCLREKGRSDVGIDVQMHGKATNGDVRKTMITVPRCEACQNAHSSYSRWRYRREDVLASAGRVAHAVAVAGCGITAFSYAWMRWSHFGFWEPLMAGALLAALLFVIHHVKRARAMIRTRDWEIDNPPPLQPPDVGGLYRLFEYAPLREHLSAGWKLGNGSYRSFGWSDDVMLNYCYLPESFLMSDRCPRCEAVSWGSPADLHGRRDRCCRRCQFNPRRWCDEPEPIGAGPAPHHPTIACPSCGDTSSWRGAYCHRCGHHEGAGVK